jgi:hypothetical protein
MNKKKNVFYSMQRKEMYLSPLRKGDPGERNYLLDKKQVKDQRKQV